MAYGYQRMGRRAWTGEEANSEVPEESSRPSSYVMRPKTYADYVHALHGVVFDPITSVMHLVPQCSTVGVDPPVKDDVEGVCSFCGGVTLSRMAKDLTLWVSIAFYVMSLVWLMAIYEGIDGGAKTTCTVNVLVTSSMALFDYLQLRLALALLAGLPGLYMLCMVGFRQQQIANGLSSTEPWHKLWLSLMVALLMVGALFCIAMDFSVAIQLGSKWGPTDACYLAEQAMPKHVPLVRIGLMTMPITQAVLTIPLFGWSVLFLIHEAFPS
jgi:hypothetical protein